MKAVIVIPTLSDSDKKRFWRRVTKSNTCWYWNGSTGKRGYGRFPVKIDNKWKVVPAHRASHCLHGGTFTNGVNVLHSCRSKNCVRPDHLSDGTQRQNTGPDKVRDGTTNRGERCGAAKLTERDVKIIREACANGATQQSVADLFAVGQQLVSLIINRKRWSHI